MRRNEMGLKSTLRKVVRAIPVIIAYAPVIADGVRQVKKAINTPDPAGDAPRA